MTSHDVLGVRIAVASPTELARALESRRADRALVVNVCNVHSVVTARRDPSLASALAAGDLNAPDGMPLVWFLRTDGHEAAVRLNGSLILDAVIRHGLARGWRHFFYGATADTLERLAGQLARTYPGIELAGFHAPPFGPLDGTARERGVAAIRDARPDIVWIGLGMPKQEKWMHDVRAELPGTVLVGIGAVFDFVAGTKPTAPAWMQERGLEWLFRLGSEPRRLFWRYASTNPQFLTLWANHLVGRWRQRR